MRRLGAVLGAAALTIVGIAGCASQDANGNESANSSSESGSSSDSNGSNKGNEKSANGESGSAYCTQVEGVQSLIGKMSGTNPEEAKAGIEKLNGKVDGVIDAAPSAIKGDWETMRTGFDRLSGAYDILDGIDEAKLVKVGSGTPDEMKSAGLTSEEQQQVTDFRAEQQKIAGDMSTSGNAISKQVKKSCDITIG